MKVLSFRDLMVCEELSHIKNEIELLHPSNDGLVNSLLVQLGFDVKREVLYEASKHRDLKGHVAIGFCACGEYSTDQRYKKFLGVTDRIVIAGMRDPSLGREMALSQGSQSSYRNCEDQWNDGSRAKKDDARYYTDEELLEMGWSAGDDADGEYASAEYIEDNWEATLRAIRQLEEIRDAVRGKV
jgi:hypothetical protein